MIAILYKHFLYDSILYIELYRIFFSKKMLVQLIKINFLPCAYPSYNENQAR